jgi:hypothetical protein
VLIIALGCRIARPPGGVTTPVVAHFQLVTGDEEVLGATELARPQLPTRIRFRMSWHLIVLALEGFFA